jgi:hypothetical protein
VVPGFSIHARHGSREGGGAAVAHPVRIGRRLKTTVGPTCGAHASAAAGGGSGGERGAGCWGRGWAAAAAWAVRGRGPRRGCAAHFLFPFLFFYFKTDFLQFNSCSKTKQNKRKQINKNQAKIMLQHECKLKHVSTLYLILFNFVNYLIIPKNSN